MESLTKNRGIKQSMVDQGKSSDESLKAYQMIDLAPLNVRKDSEWQPKLESELEDVWIHEEDDEQAIHIIADLYLIEKSQLVHMMK